MRKIIEDRVLTAQTNPREIEALLNDFMPFIKKQLGQYGIPGFEYEDRLSIAMIAFVSSIKQYEEGRGSFIIFAKRNINCRLIDECRRIRRYHSHITFLQQESDEEVSDLTDQASLNAYSLEQERAFLQEEIKSFSTALAPFQVTFMELASICPKQKRSRRQCTQIAAAIYKDQTLLSQLNATKRLPQKELAARFGISIKTIEKYRKYIVALTVLMAGDFPAIQTFIPKEAIE